MRDGTVLGLKVDLITNMGAYLQLLTLHPAARRHMYLGIYKFEAHDPSCTEHHENKTLNDDEALAVPRRPM